MKDPFQAAFEDQEVSPPHSPTPPPSASNYHQTPADDDDDDDDLIDDRQLAVETDRRQSNDGGVRAKDNNNDDEEEDDENMAEAEFSNANPGDPEKMARMQYRTKWIKFHGLYDVAYIVKLLTERPMVQKQRVLI